MRNMIREALLRLNGLLAVFVGTPSPLLLCPAPVRGFSPFPSAPRAGSGPFARARHTCANR